MIITSRVSSQFRPQIIQCIIIHHENDKQKEFTFRIKVTNLSSVPIRAELTPKFSAKHSRWSDEAISARKA